MLNEFLKKTWAEVVSSDYDFKSNTFKHVIEIDGNELKEGDDSLILVYYNVYTNLPMIILQHYHRKGVETEVVAGYHSTVNEGVDENGEDFTEIVYIAEEIKTALDN